MARFLSTPSARRATTIAQGLALDDPISIHALREEGDDPLPTGQGVYCYFYPRPPRGGRPLWLAPADGDSSISIHALREEGDHITKRYAATADNFYPRPPRGGRLCSLP